MKEYIFSPSINHDQTWEPVKQYIEEKLELHETDEERFYFDEYEPEELEKIIGNHFNFWDIDLVYGVLEKILNVQNLYLVVGLEYGCV